MTSPRDPARLRQGLNPIITSPVLLGVYNPSAATPLSAVSMSSTHVMPVQTPSSAIQPYNPQEWIATPVVTPEQQLHELGDVLAGTLPADERLVREAMDRGVPTTDIKPRNAFVSGLSKILGY